MATRPTKLPLPMAADLYGDIEPSPKATWRGYWPGLAIVAAGTLAAGFLSDHYGVPLTLMALLIGLALNFLSADVRLTPGLAFASRSLLRWGIVLVGVRITVGQIVALGPMAFFCVLGIVAVAICGASAAMALATTLGEKRASQAQLTLVLVGISAMSAAAMMVYPLIAHALHLSDLKAGFLMGAAIHDVAQALGAGYSYSEGAGQIAAIVKLTRVALLAPVLAVMAMFLRGEGGRGEGGGAKGPGVPWFVVGFFVLAGINSFGVIPAVVAMFLRGEGGRGEGGGAKGPGVPWFVVGFFVLAARRLGFGTAFGVLAGGAVAICGASAAMALATTLGEKRASQAQLTLVLVGISAMSAAAMMVYPLIAHALHLSDLKAGFLMGAAIHDVAQALGAGYSYSEGAGPIAAIVKLTRVALLAPVLAVVAMFLRGEGGRGEGGGAKGPGVPWFVVGFFVLAGINSFGVIPAVVAGGAETLASGLLAAAVTATAIRSPLSQLLEAGPRPLLVILAATLVALGLALGAVWFLIG